MTFTSNFNKSFGIYRESSNRKNQFGEPIKEVTYIGSGSGRVSGIGETESFQIFGEYTKNAIKLLTEPNLDVGGGDIVKIGGDMYRVEDKFYDGELHHIRLLLTKMW